MPNQSGVPDNTPLRYVGPNADIVPVKKFPRQPLTTDKRYPLVQMAVLGKSPSTGVEGELWYLSKFTSGNANWLKLASGGSGPLLNFDIDANTAPGTDPVLPSGTGAIALNGAVVDQHGVPIETHSRAANAINLEVQVASAVTGAPGNKNAVGMAQFDDTAFAVNADGYVTLAGGVGPAADSFNVDANTAPGTDPVVPTGAGLVNMAGAVVANHDVPLETHSRAANSINWEIQLAKAVTATPGDNVAVGVASYNDAQFVVDGTSGMVSLVGGGTGPAFVSLDVDANTGPGTDPVVADGSGLINLNGAVVAAHSVPVETHSRAVNTANIEVQVASAVTGDPSNKDAAGLCQFDDTAFGVTADGYVTFIGSSVGGSAFSAYLETSTTGGVTGAGTAYTVIFTNDSTNGAFDRNGDYNVATGVFTAPADGDYFFGAQLTFEDLSAAMTNMKNHLLILGREHRIAELNAGAVRDGTSDALSMGGSTIVRLSQNDTVSVVAKISNGGGDDANLQGSALSRFYGYKLP